MFIVYRLLMEDMMHMSSSSSSLHCHPLSRSARKFSNTSESLHTLSLLDNRNIVLLAGTKCYHVEMLAILKNSRRCLLTVSLGNSPSRLCQWLSKPMQIRLYLLNQRSAYSSNACPVSRLPICVLCRSHQCLPALPLPEIHDNFFC